MKKMNVQELKEELLNNEMSFVALDNFMQKNGYWSVFDEGTTEEIKKDKNVVYTAVDTCECEVIINFTITINNGEDECEEAFELLVTSIEKF